MLFSSFGFFFEVKNLLRTFYFPILLLSFFAIRDEIRISDMTLFSMIFLYLFFIFVPTIFGVGYQTYHITKAGSLGFFNSANEISGIISIVTPILFLLLVRFKRWGGILLFSLLYLFVILNVGTKTPLLSLLITSCVSVLYLLYFFFKKREWNKIILSFVIVFLGVFSFLLVLPRTNFYKNIRVHLDYLGLEHVSDVFHSSKYVDHFIFSSRLQFMNHKAKIYGRSNLYEKLFGIGYFHNGRETKLIEMDYFDIFYSHGIFGFLLFFASFFFVLYHVFSSSKMCGFERVMRYVSFFLILFLAFFTGHIITAPAVSYVAIIVLFSIGGRGKRDLLFTDYSLSLGGIENAQINLLHFLDYEKYRVSVILEKKEGELLERVPQEVIVREVPVSNHSNLVVRKVINALRKLFFFVFEYYNYDFSCCFTTYSYSSNLLARLASSNSSFYVHSDYRYVYDTEEEIRAFFDSRSIYKFRKIIFVSNEALSSFLSWYPDLESRCFVFNNFIDTKTIRGKSLEKIDIKKKKGSKLFVFVGRLDDSSKKVGRAISIVREIKDSELWIVGDGPDRDLYEKIALEYKVSNRVKFIGAQINPYPYMREADYILLTSNYEGFPVTYLEAICLGKKIITTIPTSDEAIDMRDYAFIVSRDDKKIILDVLKVLEDKKKGKVIDLDEIQKKRIEKLNMIFDGEV